MEPFASKNRPESLKEFVGQEHLIGLKKPLRNAIENKFIFSFILWGPPGVGKTTLAKIYAKSLNVDFYHLSAVSASKEDIKKIILTKDSDHSLSNSKILFLDEIHRFNKAQQDFLLPYVENGQLTLIGATTENPSFEVIPALLSRCQVFTLNALSKTELSTIIEQNGFNIEDDAKEWVVNMSNGDARQALSILEKTKTLYKIINLENLKDTLQNNYLRYDKKSEEHYNTISAFIKSMRSSDVDAALYYLARMVQSGEDPIFIARRMVIFASEDIALADNNALTVANNVFRAVETIGYPECAINLAHGVCYLSLAKKNRNSYNAYFEAVDDVKKYGNLSIPLNIRNAPTKLMKDLGYSDGYKMYNNESLLPEKLKNKKYFRSI